MAHKKHRGATETLNTPKTWLKPQKKGPRNQYRLPVAKKLVQQARNNQQSKQKRGEGRDRECTECKLANGDEIRSAVTVTTRVLPVENPRTSLENEDTQKVEEKALPEKTQKEKCKRKA